MVMMSLRLKLGLITSNLQHLMQPNSFANANKFDEVGFGVVFAQRCIGALLNFTVNI